MPYQSVNPVTGQVFQIFEEHTDRQMMDSLAAADKTYREIWSPAVFINCPSISYPDLPFGGIKRSGYGKELSNLGIEEFINKRLVCVAKGPSLVA